MGFKIENGVLREYIKDESIEAVIPNNVTSIGYQAFLICRNLVSIVIPNSVTSIRDWAFYGCSRLKTVNIPDSVTSIGFGAFHGCKGLANENGFIIIKNVLYGYYGEDKEVTIPDSVTSIGDEAFSGCKRLTSIIVPDSVENIGRYAFYGCLELINVVMSNQVKNIGKNAFCHCPKLKSKLANYKAFNIQENDIVCRDYIFKLNEWAKEISEIELCKKGYHYCNNLFEIFNYYWGAIDKDIAIYECEVGEKVIHNNESSKCVTNKIKPVKRLYQKDIINILKGDKEQN